MSEYGCITNNRTFEEVAALYSPEMTSVFSGGLVYEYSEEGNNYGLVTINGNTATPNDQFTYLETAYKNTPNPTGLGGAKTSSPASNCPPESAQWQVANDDLPAIPAPAAAYMKSGAGKGPGLSGPGSQAAGTTENESTGTASAGSGTVTETASASSGTSTSTAKSAAARVGGGFSVVVALLSSLVMGMLLL
jgi:hypothetical protein